MLSHVHLGISDFGRALAFYRAVLAAVGCVEKFVEPEVPWAGFMRPEAPRPLLLIGRPRDGGPASPGNGQMVALLAPSRAAVRAFHAAGLRLGGIDEGGPGLRPHYHPDYYGAYLRDPDGNKLCACCHDAEPPG